MLRHSGTLMILWGLLFVGSFPVRAAAPGTSFVLIIADDLNWNDTGAYGHPHIRTPHIDRLAREGLRFDRAYVTTSSCSPSRSSILTGRYPHVTGAEQLHWPLPAEAVTFTEKLRTAGYFTAAAGKWHLGQDVKDRFDVIHEASSAGFQLPDNRSATPARMIAPDPSGCGDWVRTLQERPRDKPFFLWLASLDPHREYADGALTPPHSTEQITVPAHLPDTPEVREDLRLYYDEIGRLDGYVGRVLQELEEQGIADSTCVMLISDNGRPFPADKATLTEGGIRTPLIVRWPSRIPAGRTTSSLASTVDLAPTILTLAGVPVPSSFQGVSLVPIFDDPSATVRDAVFAERHWHDYEDHARAVITSRFKLIRNDYPDLPLTPPADAGRSPTWEVMKGLHKEGKLTSLQARCFEVPRTQYELYDLRADPGEEHSLAGDPASHDTLSSLIRKLDIWSRETEDFLPSKRTPDEFDRETALPIPGQRKRPRPSRLQMFGTTGQY